MATWGTGISLKGKDGSKIYFITGMPTDANASAIPGDVAFSTDSYTLYQRGANGWPTDSSAGALLRGPMGFNGINGNFYSGANPPDASLGTTGNSVYFQTNGLVYIRQDGQAWMATGDDISGDKGDKGDPGLRGTQTYTGNGAPSTNLSSFSPPAQPGDLYYDLSGGPTLYVLGS